MGVTLGAITMRVRRTKGGSVRRSRLSISKLIVVSAAVTVLASGCGGPKVPTAQSQAGAPGAVALGDNGAAPAGVSDGGATPVAVNGGVAMVDGWHAKPPGPMRDWTQRRP